MIVVGILFLLQAIPFTGVFLMLIGASLWSAPLINLAVVVAGLEAIFGRIPRGFVLLPVLWFGLYALNLVREDAGLSVARDFVARENAAAVPVTYDPGRHDIVSGEFVDELLVKHRVPMVYVPARSGTDDAMVAARLVEGPLCETLRSRETVAKVDVRDVHHSRLRLFGVETTGPLCIVSLDEPPSRTVLRVSRKESVERRNGLPVNMVVTRVEGGGQSAEIRGGSARLLTRFPLPVLGCALISSPPAWKCVAEFMRHSLVRFGTTSDDGDLLALVLDTSRDAPRSEEAANAAILAALAAADERVAAQERADAARREQKRLDELEAFLREPGAYSITHEIFHKFADEPDALAPYADRLIAALETEDASERQTREIDAFGAAYRIAQLVAQLPDADIVRHGDRILTVLDGPIYGWRRARSPLLTRIGVLGTAAVPMLLRRLETTNGRKRLPALRPPAIDAVVALCRMGPPASEAVGNKLLDIWRQRSSPRPTDRGAGDDQSAALEPPRLARADRYVYVALLRLGLRDETGVPELDEYGEAWWESTWRTVSPRSSPDACEQVD